MTKEEILAKSRNENKGADFVEREVLRKANQIALGAMMIASGIMSILTSIFTEKVCVEVWVVVMATHGTTFMVKYVAMKKRHELALSIFYFVLCVFFLVCFFVKVVGA